MGSHIMDVGGDLKKMRITSGGQEIGEWIPHTNPQVIEQTKQAFADGEGCNIKGFITVNRVPGNFHISFHNYRQVLAHVGMVPNLTHSIHELAWGRERQVNKVKKLFKGAYT